MGRFGRQAGVGGQGNPFFNLPRKNDPSRNRTWPSDPSKAFALKTLSITPDPWPHNCDCGKMVDASPNKATTSDSTSNPPPASMIVRGLDAARARIGQPESGRQPARDRILNPVASRVRPPPDVKHNDWGVAYLRKGMKFLMKRSLVSTRNEIRCLARSWRYFACTAEPGWPSYRAGRRSCILRSHWKGAGNGRRGNDAKSLPGFPDFPVWFSKVISRGSIVANPRSSGFGNGSDRLPGGVGGHEWI